ncbi:TlpA family protein disulfide reductase [Cupriavidus gilardii]|uniref:TlpA family protein disulfide reductase n=1 Tax=Cupriavidus gilardii TaxID=82541 RepID=UPI00158046CA|nr:TlpA disulfide reductase family protein [Cupriavidus gilardii]MCT9073737.1 TlpA family protein disulfide reductase [Cupriavidus gilardii]QKS64605.1 TlpA family protein disulfide reductase [Cupriavidus gilardii]
MKADSPTSSAPPSPPQPARRGRVLFWLAIAVAAAIAGAVVGNRVFSPQPASDQAVEALYRIELPDADGKPIRMDTLRGKTVVVNFWAPWCGPCVEEMPDLTALHQEYQSRGVEFVGIGIDSASNIREFVQKVPVAYPLAVAGFAGTELTRSFGNAAGGLPYTVVIDAQGVVRLRKMGRVMPDELRAVLPRG